MKENARRRNISAVLLIMLFLLAAASSGCGGKKENNSGNASSSGINVSGKPQFILFTQPGCPPCEDARLLVRELKKEMGGRFEYREVDISRDPATSRKYNVQATPTEVILDKSGVVVKFFVGLPEKAQLKASLEKALPR